MIKKIKALSLESIFFHGCLLLGLTVVIWNPLNPTLDGPSHIYNAQLINYLVKGNRFISDYYTLNKIPAPNLADHYLLALLLNVFSWQVSEKLMSVLYLLSFPLLFRKLIKQWNDANVGLSIFAIPFSFSYLYYMGFYNFCLSFPVLFGLIIYYRKYFCDDSRQPSAWNYLLISIIATLLYFTNGLAFVIGGILLFLFEFFRWIGHFKQYRKVLLKRVLFFLLIWVPGILCFIAFLRQVHTNSGPYGLTFPELMDWVRIVRPLLVYGVTETKYTQYFFYAACICFLTSVYLRAKSGNLLKFYVSDSILLLSAIIFVLYLVIPDAASVGWMSVRLSYFFFIFIIMWIATQKGSKLVTWGIAIFVMIIHFKLLLRVHQPVISGLTKKVKTLEEAGKFIKPNTVMLSVDVTGDWLAYHLPDYIGADKPVVIVDNYEANDGWFAVSWNTYTLPQMLLNGKSLAPPFDNLSPVSASEINYIFVYGQYDDILQKQQWETLRKIINEEYTVTYVSPNSDIHIFSLQQSRMSDK
jgi:hypothetical protein